MTTLVLEELSYDFYFLKLQHSFSYLAGYDLVYDIKIILQCSPCYFLMSGKACIQLTPK
jgi:hypothetical protein